MGREKFVSFGFGIVSGGTKEMASPKFLNVAFESGIIHHFKQVMHGLTPPKGELYSAVEVASGELGFYIVSDGEGKPYRLRIRPPCFIYYQGLERMVKGQMIADLIAVLGSINIVAGELDR